MELFFKIIGGMVFTVGISLGIIKVMAWFVMTDLSQVKLRGMSSKATSLPKSFWVVVSIITALYGLFFLILQNSVTPFDDKSTMVSNVGQFGDSFGILNGLFSALGFAILLVTLFEQQKQLKKQQEEIDENRTIMITQQFEQSFFKMLEMHHNIVRDIDIRIRGEIAYQGRDCFRFFHNKLKKAYIYASSAVNTKDELILINTAYSVLYKKHQSDLGHYFRNIYNIIKFVNNSHIVDKKMYVNFLRAQLSSHELDLLFYNCLTYYGCEMFKPLVEKYEFLENMEFGLLIDANHIDLYSKSAFGNSLA